MTAADAAGRAVALEPRPASPEVAPAGGGRPLVPEGLDRLTAWSWRLLVIGAAVVAAGVLVARLRFVVLVVVVALLLATVLVPPARWMQRRGLPALASAWVTVAGSLLVLSGTGAFIVPPLVEEFGDLASTLETSLDEVEEWLVDGPLRLDAEQVADGRQRLSTLVDDAVHDDAALVSGAVLAGEVMAGAILALVVAFFLVKDGERLQSTALSLVPAHRRAQVARMAGAAWSALGRYLLGAAMLGAVEAVIIGLTLALTGSALVLPVAALTFVSAFFPFVGAIVSGTVAALVALVSGGAGDAAVVAAVALAVQQLDNDLLAPLIYSRALRLHPLAVILAMATGAILGGLPGAFLAIPTVAVAAGVTGVARADPASGGRADSATDSPTVEASARQRGVGTAWL